MDNNIQKLFEDAGYDLEEDNNAAELADSIVDLIQRKASTQETWLGTDVDTNKAYPNTKSRIVDLVRRILFEPTT